MGPWDRFQPVRRSSLLFTLNCMSCRAEKVSWLFVSPFVNISIFFFIVYAVYLFVISVQSLPAFQILKKNTSLAFSLPVLFFQPGSS